MTEVFVASNGVHVHPNKTVNGKTSVESSEAGHCLGGEMMQALREFFLHERDKELGRWRWPEHPDYVVYLDELDYVPGRKIVRVIRESTGKGSWFAVDGFEVFDKYDFTLAANAYISAHPAQKPWHDAEPGEVWELTYLQLGEPKRTRPFVVDSSGRFRTTQGVRVAPFREIVGGRRIWPEVVSDA